MRIVIDYDLCEANAVCCRKAPEVFRLDADDNLHLKIENPDESLRPKLEAAVLGCPKRAIKLVEE